MIKFFDTDFDGLKTFEMKKLSDERGNFIKLFHRDIIAQAKLDGTVGEIYSSTSQKGVIRGMHFQVGEKAQKKIVFCLSGSLFDAAVDLRPNSPTYGKSFSIMLSAQKGNGVYIPEGFAHGLQSLEDNTVLLNICSNVYDPESEQGISCFGCGISWPIEEYVLSEKDAAQVPLNDYLLGT